MRYDAMRCDTAQCSAVRCGLPDDQLASVAQLTQHTKRATQRDDTTPVAAAQTLWRSVSHFFHLHTYNDLRLARPYSAAHAVALLFSARAPFGRCVRHFVQGTDVRLTFLLG